MFYVLWREYLLVFPLLARKVLLLAKVAANKCSAPLHRSSYSTEVVYGASWQRNTDSFVA